MRRLLTLMLGLALVACVALETPPEAEPEPEASAIPPPGIAPRTLSRPDGIPRSAAVRALSQGRFTINVQDAEIGGLLLGLGRGVPLNIVVGSEVTGTVSADLEEVTLLDILEQIVRPRGFHYTIDGRTVRIFESDRETRFYKLNYPNTRRESSTEFTVSGAIAQEAAGEGSEGGGGSDESASAIATTRSADLWSEVEAGVRLIVLGSTEGEVGQSTGEQDANGLSGHKVLVSRQAGVVMVTAPSSALSEVEQYLETVARNLVRQVLIDARIVEVSLKDELDLGLDVEYSPSLHDNHQGVFDRVITGGIARSRAIMTEDLAPTLASGGFSFGVATDDVGVILKALARQTDLRVISTPRVATLSNHKALIKVVRNEIFFVAETEVTVTEGVAATAVTDFEPSIIPIGVTLDVTPNVTESGEITMHVHPSVSEIVEIREQPMVTGQTDTGSLPVVDIRETDTVLRVMDGQTIVIGGLIQRRELDIEKKVPLLGDIPWLGQLFRQSDVEEKQAELLIFLTPTVLDPPAIEKVVADGYEALGTLDAARLSRKAIRTPWWRRPRKQQEGF